MSITRRSITQQKVPAAWTSLPPRVELYVSRTFSLAYALEVKGLNNEADRLRNWVVEGVAGKRLKESCGHWVAREKG